MENEKQGLEMPSENVTISINGDVIKLELPTVGEFIAIERRKIALSGGNYGSMLNSMTEASIGAYTDIEVIATMEILIKDLKKRLRVDSLTELKPYQLMELKKQYTDKVFPWLNEWRSFINAPVKAEKDESEGTDSKVE